MKRTNKDINAALCTIVLQQHHHLQPTSISAPRPAATTTTTATTTPTTTITNDENVSNIRNKNKRTMMNIMTCTGMYRHFRIARWLLLPVRIFILLKTVSHGAPNICIPATSHPTPER